MDSALAWIGQIAEWIGKFVPRWIILDTTEGGVKFVRGRKVVLMEPGIHWYWPATTSYNTYPTANQTDELRSQTIVTADGKTIDLSALIRYQVDDVAKLLSENYQAKTAIADVSLAAIHDVCCRMTWGALQLEQRKGTLKTKLRKAVAKEVRALGVQVHAVTLTDMSVCRVLKLKQSTRTDGEI
jgi:regulator of protease activity HflC (stomatin/prohibitin superfamily)